MIDQCSCEGEHDWLVLLDGRRRLLIGRSRKAAMLAGVRQTTLAIAFALSMSLAMNCGGAFLIHGASLFVLKSQPVPSGAPGRTFQHYAA